MSQTLQLVQELVERGEIRISEHGYDELSADNISVKDLFFGLAGAALHVVWGIPKSAATPADGSWTRRHTVAQGVSLA